MTLKDNIHIMKTQLVIWFLIVSGCLSAIAQKKYEIISPDGKLKAEIIIETDIRFSLTHDGTEVLASSPISMKLQNGVILGANPKVRKTTTSSVDKRISSPFYKKNEVTDLYNETIFSFRDNFGLVFRLYDDGLAYRFTTSMKDSIIITDESGYFGFSKDYRTIAPYARTYKEGMTFEQQFVNSFQNVYTHETITKLDRERLLFLPLIVNLDNGKRLCITEADLEDYPGMFLNNVPDQTAFRTIYATYPKETITPNQRNIRVKSREDYIAKTKGTRSFPWRVFIISEKDEELADNDMVFRLSSPNRIADISWIRPGKVAWEWWSAANLYNVDFRAGMNNDTYKYFIDFASENGVEYVILDGGWYNQKTGSIMESVPEIDVAELISYGNARKVGIILWAGFYPFQKEMERAVTYYAGLGVKGFKVDFFDRDDQEVVKFLYDAAALCAEHKMILNLHGIFKPAGLQRTYPNVLNFEGVYGLENVKWAKEPDMVTYDVTIPFIRMLAGPMDYTQGAMQNAIRKNYRPVYSEPISQGTRCRQLAMYVIFESPLSMLCDNPLNYRREQECTDFIAKIPTVWDETVVLTGKIGEHIAIARRKEKEWYVGVLTDWDTRELELDLSFLDNGSFHVELFEDGINADRAARDYKKENIRLPADKRLKIKMAPGGGFAARIY